MEQPLVLLTGGAGFYGYHAANYLAGKGYRVRVYDLVDPDHGEYPAGTEFRQNDVRDRESVRRALQDVSLVVHAAAALPLWSREDIMTTNVDGTRIILEESQKAKVDRAVYISSTAIYGVPERHPIYETDPMVGVGPYGESKILAEKACREFREKGLCVPVLRPKTFIGTARLGIFQVLYDWVESGKHIPVIGNGQNRYQLMEVEDLCFATYLTLIGELSKVNDTFNVGAQEFQTVNADLGALCEYAKTCARVMHTPAGLVKLALALFEKIHLSPLYKWIYGTADKDSFVSTEKIEKVLGWKAEYSNAAALIRSYQWYLEHKNEIQGQVSGVTHRVAWKQGILGLVKKFM
ncbi:MAG: NAD(P)-dependent oxidoreductase [Candidatus Liptonbacteria bacterium]|nr:NAD(P)-dependent oxidoreductase [Candidatus Liptonbacteria bacterium]